MAEFIKTNIKNLIRRIHCRICNKSGLVKILDLGMVPPANSFLKKKDLKKPELKFPLTLHFCKNCGLLQLLDILNPELLFRNYPYLTSTSPPLVDHFIELGKTLENRFIESKNDLVIDIGGNDAVLLNSIKNKCRVLNVEPAKNIARISRRNGIDTISEFFNKALAEKILRRYGQAKVITISNVFAHIDEPEDVVEGAKILLADNGVFVIEVHWVANLLGLAGVGSFDQTYHEHLSYFSLSALKRLIDDAGLKIFDAKLIPVHGKSLQVYISKNPAGISESAKLILKKEKELGLDKTKTYLDFAKKVGRNKKELRRMLFKLKKENKKIAGYGASAKGNILLNYFQIDAKILNFIIDDSPLKQGLYTPGAHIPVFSAKKLRSARPDYLLLLAWNYADFILKKEEWLRKKGVKFIIPTPEIKIV